MSFGIVRLQKITSGSVRGIQSHDKREKDPRTNPDIDKSRTPDNYAMVECSIGYNQAIKERVQALENQRTVRKDAVMLCQFLVTSDTAFFQKLTPDKEKEFFRQSLDFLANRYGRENIISATIHKDEKTPHMHVNLVPVKDGRLSAKAIFGNRKELQDLQTEFHREVGQAWDMQRGQSREDKRRHQDVTTFKRTTAEAELEKVQAELAQAKAQSALELEKAKAELEKTKMELSRFKGVQEGTAKAMAQAQAWSIEKGKQEVERRQREREERERQEQPAALDLERARLRKQVKSHGLSIGG